MEMMMSLCVGIGLSAACGFRVFIPLLMVSVAERAGHLTLAGGFSWLGSDAALIAFSVATVLEIGAYYIPWLDNLLDSIATPAAVVAGTIVTASMVANVSPFLQWTLAVIAGGGTAGLVQASTVLARGTSTLTTGGIGNPAVATAELGGSVLMGILAIAAPIVAALALLVLLIFLGRKFFFKKADKPANGCAS